MGPSWVIVRALAQVIGLPTAFAPVLIPLSGAAVAVPVWWALVENRGDYSSLTGGAALLVTGLLTVVCWSAPLAFRYGPRIPLAAQIVLVPLVAVTSLAAFVAGLPMMYVRRRFGGVSAVGPRQ